MKRFSIALFFQLATFAAIAQPTSTTPQSVVSTNFFNGVSTAQNSADFTNVGQTMHFVFYSAGGASGAPTGVLIRITASFDGTTYFAISDDGTAPGQNNSNLVVGIGAYPHIRAELIGCTGCDGNNTISASYTGTSSIPGNPFGKYGAGQQVRKVALNTVSTDSTQTSSFIVTPFGSSAGYLLVSSSGSFPATPTISVRDRDFTSVPILLSYSLPTTGALSLAIPIPATTVNTVDVRYTKIGAATGNTFSAFYVFFPPGSAQPASSQPADAGPNAETTAVGATASITLTPSSFQRGHIFSVSGRCSAGTAQLLVVDTTTSTNLWTSAATEVGITTFKNLWNPGLAGKPGDVVQVQLTTCGGGNTGTLDVQGSIF